MFYLVVCVCRYLSSFRYDETLERDFNSANWDAENVNVGCFRRNITKLPRNRSRGFFFGCSFHVQKFSYRQTAVNTTSFVALFNVTWTLHTGCNVFGLDFRLFHWRMQYSRWNGRVFELNLDTNYEFTNNVLDNSLNFELVWLLIFDDSGFNADDVLQCLYLSLFRSILPVSLVATALAHLIIQLTNANSWSRWSLWNSQQLLHTYHYYAI